MHGNRVIRTRSCDALDRGLIVSDSEMVRDTILTPKSKNDGVNDLRPY